MLDRVAMMNMIARICSTQLDMTLRAAILEGVAGVTPLIWARLSGGKGLELAAKALPDLNPEWFSFSDTGTCEAILRGAHSGGRGGKLTQEAANDILQEIVGGLTLRAPGGEPYDVGKKLAHGGKPSLSEAQAMLARHARGRVISEGRKDPGVSLTQDLEDGGAAERDLPSSAGNRSDKEIFADLMASPKGPHIARIIQNKMYQVYPEGGSKRAIFDKWLEDPNKDAVSMAKELGKLFSNPKAESATYVSRILRDIWSLIGTIVRTDKQIQRILEMMGELEPLGYGHRAAAKRLSSWFAAQDMAQRLAAAGF